MSKLFQHDGLQGICDAANDFNADLFVSIHCNAFDGKAQGTETYHFYGSSSGKRLAEAIHNQLLDSLPLLDRKIKEAGFTVLANTDMPDTLVTTSPRLSLVVSLIISHKNFAPGKGAFFVCRLSAGRFFFAKVQFRTVKERNALIQGLLLFIVFGLRRLRKARRFLP